MDVFAKMYQDLGDKLTQLERESEEEFQRWMLLPSTIEGVQNVLESMNVHKNHGKKIISILYMHKYDDVFGENDHDVIMKREVQRFYPIFLSYLNNQSDPPVNDVTRILRFFHAWRQEDVAMLATFENEEHQSSS